MEVMESNRVLLEEVINDTLAYVREHPEDDVQQKKLEALLKASSERYKVTMEAYNQETKNLNDREIEERKLELQEKELEETKRYHRGDIISKLFGTAAATGTAVLAIKWESVGEFVHGIALKIGPKFRS